MTINTELSKRIYTGNGVTMQFDYDFKIFVESDLAVSLIAADGTETVQVLNTDYTVSGEGFEAGGKVSFAVAPAVGVTILILSAVPFTQPTDYKNQGRFFPETHENSYDRVTRQILQVREAQNRSVTLPAYVEGVNTEMPAPVVSTLWGWNNAANAPALYSITDIATYAAYANKQYQTFTGTGAQVNFTLAADPGSLGNLEISIDGVMQVPVADFTFLSTTLTFATAPANGSVILVRYDQALPTGITNATAVNFLQGGTGARTRDLQTKLREVQINLFDFIPIGEQAAIASRTSTYDCSTDIQAACNYAKSIGGGTVYAPAGTYRMGSGITNTDAMVRIVGAGPLGVAVTGTVFKAVSAMTDMFLFNTATVSGTDVPIAGGISECTLDGNSLAANCVHVQSVYFCEVVDVRMYGFTTRGLWANCGASGQPSCQFNWFDKLFITASGAADCVFLDGNQDVGGLGNFSLNQLGYISTINSFGTTGNGIVFKNCDGNVVEYHRHFGGGTGYAELFWGSDVAANYTARHNCIKFVQAGPNGVRAKSGTVANSGPNRILLYSAGNGSADPTIDAGALLGWNNTYTGCRGTFTPRLFGGSVAGTPTYTVQKGRWSVLGNRLFFDLQITISAIGGISGTLKIDGMPFTHSSATGTDVVASVTISQWALTLVAGNSQLSAVSQQGQSNITFFQSGSGIAPTAVVGSQLMATSTFVISGSYPMQGA